MKTFSWKQFGFLLQGIIVYVIKEKSPFQSSVVALRHLKCHFSSQTGVLIMQSYLGTWIIGKQLRTIASPFFRRRSVVGLCAPSVLRGPVCKKTISQMSRHLSICCVCPWFCLCPCLCTHNKLGKKPFFCIVFGGHTRQKLNWKNSAPFQDILLVRFLARHSRTQTHALSLSIGERKVGCQTRVRGGEGPRVAKPKAASKEDDRLAAF